MLMLWSEHNVLRNTALNNDSQLGQFGPHLRGHVAMSEDTFDCHDWVSTGIEEVKPGCC